MEGVSALAVEAERTLGHEGQHDEGPRQDAPVGVEQELVPRSEEGAAQGLVDIERGPSAHGEDVAMPKRYRRSPSVMGCMSPAPPG